MSLHAPAQNTAEGSFLTFLEKDLINRPSSIRPVTTKTGGLKFQVQRY